MELISAIATAQGRGGVAIVRVSGEGALSLAKSMFSRKETFEPNRLYPGKIDGGDISDYGMCVYFCAPHSFTGEDCIEFHCHGGAEIARSVLKKTLMLGARLAQAGEFTRRAYLNGKLSLSAVEGMGEMIYAQSAAQVRAGFLLYSEKLTAETKSVQNIVRECLALCDADVDYPEEDLTRDVCKEIIQKTEGCVFALKTILSQYSLGEKIKNGVAVALVGAPNAGKSSLFNALIGYDRAIVSPHAGTTRDFVEGEVEIHGVLFKIIDTAGLREGGGEIEREGMRRTELLLRSSDLILYLKEEGDGFSIPEDIPCFIVGAKCDLQRKEHCDILVSSVTGEGIEELKEMIFSKGFGRENEEAFLLEERHYQALTESLKALIQVEEGARRGIATELIAEDLMKAYKELGKISGETASEEIIEEIFAKFCVGK